MASQNVEKKTRGQQKITMERMENETARSITFSKRRKGLFSKASALATLTGAEVAIMVMSPGGRLFGFGSPNVQSVVQRYLDGGRPAPLQNSCGDVLGNLHAELRRVVAQFEAEKARGEELRRKREELEAHFWMAGPDPYHSLSPTQLIQVKARLVAMSQELTGLLDRRVNSYNHNSSSNNNNNNNDNNFAAVNPTHHQFYGGVPLPPARGIPLPPPSTMPMMSHELTRRTDRRVSSNNHINNNNNNNNNNNFHDVNPTHHEFYAGVPLPPARGIPLPPPMSSETHQNQALGGNMTMAPPPPPYDSRWNNMGGYGGPPGGFY